MAFLGQSLLGLAPELLQRTANGSGDTVYHYVHLLGLALLSFVGASAWSYADRTRSAGDLYRRWTAALSLWVGAVVLAMGLAKIFQLPQGISPLVRSLTTSAYSSPMGLAQMYLTYSPTYSIFLGIGEVLGGVLLFFRRTRTFGALILLAAISNIVMLNLLYDMPYKIFSLHLAASIGILLVADGRRILAFVCNREVPAIDRAALFSQPRFEHWAQVSKFALLGLLLVIQLTALSKKRQAAEEKPPLYGIYDVETFSIDGEERPPLLSDDLRWNVVVVASANELTLQRMDQSLETYHMDLDLADRAITLSGFRHPNPVTEWTFEQPSPDVLVMQGELEGRTVRVETQARDLTDFAPVGSKFYWVF